MSAIKRWVEDHIDELSDQDLFDFGCQTQEEVDFLRDCFSEKKNKPEELT